MNRSYTLARRIAVVRIAGDAEEAAGDLERAICARFPGCQFSLEVRPGRIAIPAGHEVWSLGRPLRGEEWERFDAAVRAGAAALPGCSVLLGIEEMYRLDWDRFTDRDYERLQRIYAALPGWVAGADLPRWFSVDEQEAHLWASVEPPGLQVGGLLDPSRFERWHADFLARTAELPFQSA